MQKINKKINNRSAFVMLFAVTLSSIVLAITLGVMNIALKELKFSTNSQDTNNAFFAADTGIEYALFHDKSTTTIYTPPPGTWNFTLPGLGTNAQSCTNVTVTKNSPPSVNTTIIADGYNIYDIGGSHCDSTNANRTQRELETTYGNPVPNAIVFVQSKSAAALSSPSANLAFASDVKVNDKIVVGLSWSYGGCPPSITDSEGNLYTQIGTVVQPGGGQYGYWFLAPVGSSGPDTLTISSSCGFSKMTFAAEYSGIASTAYDGNDGKTNSTSACSAGNVVTTSDGDLVVGMFYDVLDRVFSPTAGFNVRATNSSNDIYEEQIQNTAGAISVTATCGADGTNGSNGFMIALKHN